MKFVVFFSMVASLLGFIGCSDNRLEGQIHTNESRTMVLADSEQRISLSDGEFITMEVEKKGKLLSSKLVLKTPSQQLNIKIRKAWYLKKNEFQASASQTGLSHDLKGYPISTFVREWDEEGPNQCDAGGDCGNFNYTYNSDGTISGMYWVSATCWGSQKVIWHKKLFYDTYKIEFGDDGYFESHPKPRELNQVKEILTQCIR